MSSWILLLRGINVGGKNPLPMKELTSILKRLGLEDIRTYIQSGNVIFRCADPIPSNLEDNVATAIEERRGFKPRVLLLSQQQLEGAVESNPFPEAVEEPKTLHLYFLAAGPENPDLDALHEFSTSEERFVLSGGVFYLHAPKGIGRSKLAASVEKHLGVSATGRNWRTVRKLWEMVQAD